MLLSVTVCACIATLYVSLHRSSAAAAAAAVQQESVTSIVSKLLTNYNRDDLPTYDSATVVRLGIYINSVYSINEQTMDYSVSMYLRQQWRDPRLDYRRIADSVDRIQLAPESFNHIWTPDTFFRNEKAASFHEVTVKNRLLRLSKDGTVWYVSKISATFACPMHLQTFPFDTQSCPMMFESFGYTMDAMYFDWLPSPIDIDEGLQMPQFTMVDIIRNDCSQNYTAGAFPCLEIRFHLKRDIGYFLIQVYVPSILIVIMSWVSFWINVDASPARVSLGLLSVLTTTTMSGGARASLPKVSYIKAIDIWMICCLVFVFASLIEYAVVNALARRPPMDSQKLFPTSCVRQISHYKQVSQVMIQRRRQKSSSTVVNLPENSSDGREARSAEVQLLDLPRSTSQNTVPECVETTENTAAADKVTMIDGKTRARQVDKIARKCFPISFIVFNLVYWFHYALPR